MAIPTQPTATTICTEAYKLFGITTPTSAQITRATDYGMEIVKADIKRMGLEWDPLRTTAYLPMTVGVSYVQLPTDCAKVLSVRLMDGTSRSTLQTAGASSATLAAAETAGSNVVGKWLMITSGTGTQQALQIKAYDTSTKVATMESSWTTTPAAADAYLIVDTFAELNYTPVFDYNRLLNPHLSGTPQMCAVKSDAAEGDLYFDKAADKVYGVAIEYYADLQKIDLTATLYSRLLRLWNGLFIQGVFVWLLQDDARMGLETQRYEKMKAQTAAQHLYPNNIQNVTVALDYE